MKFIVDKIRSLKFIICFLFVVTTLLWFIFIYLSNYNPTYDGDVFNYIVKPFLVGMTLLPMFAGILAIQRSKVWGGWKSNIGRSMMSLGLGMFGWSGGMIFWNYYLFFMKVEVPYPSLGDLFYIMIWPFWTYAMISLFKVTGAKYGLRKLSGKILALVLSTVVVSVSYYFLFTIARQGQLDLTGSVTSNLLAFLYPLGDVAILLSAVLLYSLSFNFLGGEYKNSILTLVFGFVLNYIADIVFVFTTTKGTYFNGNVADFLYVIMLFTVAMGISKLDPSLLNDKKS